VKKFSCQACPIRDTSCIADLSPDKLEEFRSFTLSAIYKPRQILFHENAPASGLYVLCHGTVKLYQSGRFGRDYILSVAGPGEVLGELPLDPSTEYSASAEALTESQVCYLPRERLTRFIELHPMTGVRLIAALSDSLIAARHKVRDMVLKPAATRLAELLVQLAGNGGTNGDASRHITLAYSRRDIAEMIGVSTETAVRLLAALKARGVIATHGRDLTVTDIDKLQRLASVPF